ncbi:MAG: amidoligase family protein [Deltaproteobacteria bacterium]|nr:amidoligase family protein [Deltaproteobacteria bacterium]
MIRWKIGVEVELVAPRGSSRRALAERLAGPGGSVRAFFHPQSELSLVPDTPVFENLTLGYEARDAAGALVGRFVDDVTLQDDLDREAAPRDGWFRVVSDDARLLQLVARVGRADAGPLEAVAEVARLFGTEPDVFPGGMVRVVDRNSAPIAIATPLPGERERPCEIVTPPISEDHAARLDALLAPARALGFTLPAEAATHIHYDREALRDARVFRDLVRLVAPWAEALKALVGTNPRCRRLGPWPDDLHDVVEAPGFAALAWPDARERLAELQLTKYCDVNLKNVVHDVVDKPTIELRILPGHATSRPILEGAALFEGFLRGAIAGVSPEAPSLRVLLERLPLDEPLRRCWLDRL